MRVCPDAPGRGAFLVACIVLQTEAQRADKAALGFVLADQTPFLVKVIESRLVLGKELAFVLALVYALPVDASDLEIGGVISKFPFQVFGQFAGKVYFAEYLSPGNLVERGEKERLTARTGCNPAVIVEGFVSVESVKVHGLVNGSRSCGGHPYAVEKVHVVIHYGVELRTFGKEG